MKIDHTGRKASPTSSLTVTLPPVAAVLAITKDFEIRTCQSMPNRWRRFWYYVLLDWHWRKTE